MKRTSAFLAAALVGLIALAGCAANEEPAASPTGGATTDAATEDTNNQAEPPVQTDPEPEPPAGLDGEITGAGASSQTAAQEAWRAGFAAVQPGVTVNYDPQGSGPGRQQFQEGASDFAGTDSAFKDEEIEEGGFPQCAAPEIVEIPAYISPIAVVFNLEGISSLNLDSATLAGLFMGEITNWNDPAITGANDGVDLPDLAIVPVHRSDASGTTKNFTHYLSKTAEDVWTHGDVEEWPIQSGEAAEKTQGMKETVSAAQGTVGYIDASQ
ncbi:MAG: extracellular solute-binding protein, partial [Micrococcales bacterium]|nr:extracellular solute-binding protein [Micrococcales bacterium]